MKKIFGIFNGIPLLLTALSVFVFFYINNDAVQYTTLGYNLFHHGIYNDSYGVVPGWMQSPGWPFILGLFSWILPIHQVAPLTTLLISFIIIFLFFFFIQREFSSSVAWISVIILIINPQFLIISRSGLSEPFYLLIHFFLFIMLYEYWFKQKTFSYINIITISVLIVLLMFTRSEGILYVPIVLLVFIGYFIKNRKKQSPDRIVPYKSKWFLFYAIIFYLLIISILIIPYGNWIKSKTGYFNIMPKITFNARIGAVAHLLSQVHGLDSYNPDLMEELAWYGLDTTNNELYSVQILNNNYYEKVINKIRKDSDSWPTLPTLLIKNIEGTIRILIRSNPFPLFFVLLIFIGLYYLFKNERAQLLFIFIWLIPTFYFLVSHVQERFFYVMLPYLSFMAAYGIYMIAKKIRRPQVLSASTLILLMFNALFYYHIYYRSLQEKEVYYTVAQEIKQIIPPDKTVCAKEFQTTFYSGNEFIKMPYCSVNAFYRYLIKRKADYVLLGQEVKTFRKMFKPIYDNRQSNRFRLVKVFSTPYQEFKLFELLR